MFDIFQVISFMIFEAMALTLIFVYKYNNKK